MDGDRTGFMSVEEDQRQRLLRRVEKEAAKQRLVDATDADRRTWYPAARCRECGVITWEVSLARGRRRVETPRHSKGCSQPLGRIDLEQRRQKAGL